MSFRNAFGIYQAIEKVLKASKRPLTCVELFEFVEIKQHADDVNKVSDYLGHMYRRSQAMPSKERFIGRQPAAARSVGAARWAYYWLNPNVGTPDKMVQRSVQPRLKIVDNTEVAKRRQELEETAAVLVEEPSARVTQTTDGCITIETLHHVITISPR